MAAELKPTTADRIEIADLYLAETLGPWLERAGASEEQVEAAKADVRARLVSLAHRWGQFSCLPLIGMVVELAQWVDPPEVHPFHRAAAQIAVRGSDVLASLEGDVFSNEEWRNLTVAAAYALKPWGLDQADDADRNSLGGRDPYAELETHFPVVWRMLAFCAEPDYGKTTQLPMRDLRPAVLPDLYEFDDEVADRVRKAATGETQTLELARLTEISRNPWALFPVLEALLSDSVPVLTSNLRLQIGRDPEWGGEFRGLIVYRYGQADPYQLDTYWPGMTQRTPDEEKAGRNDPCPCGSGLKFKRCHGA